MEIFFIKVACFLTLFTSEEFWFGWICYLRKLTDNMFY